ncbi:prepilin peptidase [Reinekea thalattae]|uniref:Prepilin leader peptidase/N-methyltransferase n=1 Tax=Reinekea thalattae TaxID=2593301 RepID=A0A5C8Z486_9GAMM|nr:A24 family peptidase [Reinekea thalattae]TXR52008.1 prepilin peptidase [Reinekea thalattae]
MWQVLLTENPELFIALVFMFSLMVGSFLNVVIYRLPIMLSHRWALDAAEWQNDEKAYKKLTKQPTFNLAKPDSRCPHCQHKITLWQNIPVISWLLLRGKCASCKTSISIRYPLVELLTALLAAIVAAKFGFSMTTLALVVFIWCLVALTFIDLDTQLLPDSITLPLLWLGLLVNVSNGLVSLDQAVIGAAAGYLSLWSIYWLFKLLTGKEGMGYGDFKLFAVFGAWFGWLALPLIILLSSLVGAVVGIVMILFYGREKAKPMPFGPFLAGAALIYLFWGETIMATYLGLVL